MKAFQKLPLFLLFLLLTHTVSAQVVKELQQWLALEREARPALADQPFATKSISKKEAQQAMLLLTQDRDKYIRENWADDWQNKTFTDDTYTFKFDYKTFGEKPADGHSLYISLHGGGGTTKEVNDQQWRNQIGLYQPAEGIYVAPRAPTDSWNMWHQEHIDHFLEKLIQAAVVFEDVNPNKVYIMGYSAGGDGTFQLAPRMADHWAAAAMMAGHPGDASAANLRNIGFTIHMGGKDAAYKRNELAQVWEGLLDSLKASDPKGYAHEVQIHENLPHWMNRRDTVAVPWMAKFTRNPLPEKVVWQQDDVLKESFYWLAVPQSAMERGKKLTATHQLGEINILESDYDTVLINLNDTMLDLNKKLTVKYQGKEIFKGKVKRSILPIWQSLEAKGDKYLLFSAQLKVVN
ncbi:dienelactone hydrolase family protein [Pontibacter harenae]|uniref:dienelactone hydrolase family protein n=1 Tax=Pontibacter harenae TaxID=2894083 RepID=UPI001E4D4FD7|nr:dienelactone hydrolase family protein [Pontibacter harenae]MCC9166911.1 dienelactone hydrolase family protein [Pontibacter harenae]